ncbi:thymopoietin a isoform X1 [Engraulis encrasicolus]|uniref:thymopoietin a isoform X1 n=1 Tax=Engraulis encrasicolus TaxID=184585 RepID=UPI002FD5CAD3
MSEFLEDPSVLTKDKLKSVLLANNVSLPNSEQRKDVYVQLYLKNLTAQNKKKSAPPPEPFSSDDELPAPVVSNRSSRSGRKATKKTDKPRPEEVDVLELSDEDLREELRKYGLSVGPIVASTRKLYERKLQKLIDEGPPEATPPPEVVTETDGNQNGGAESDHYSDKEEEVAPEPEPEPEPAPVVERPLRSRGKTPVTSRAGSRSSQHNRAAAQDPPLSVVVQSKSSSRSRSSAFTAANQHPDPPVVVQSRSRSSAFTAANEHPDPPVVVQSKSWSKSSALTAAKEQPDPPLPVIAQSKSRSKSSAFSGANGNADPPVIVQSSSRSKTASSDAANEGPRPTPLSKFTSSSITSTITGVGAGEDEEEYSSSYRFNNQEQAPMLLKQRTHVYQGQSEQASVVSEKPNGKQQKITPYLSPVTPLKNGVEKVSATLDQTPKSDAKDVLKDMFPNDVDTPTGISATCRRPIRGAASRAGLSSDSWLDDATRQRLNHLSETSTSYYSSSYLESRTPSSRLLNSPAPPAYTSSSSTLYSTSISTPLRAVSVPSVRAPIGGVGSVAGGGGGRKRWMPVWVQVLVFGVLAGFLFLVYQAMETNESNPFGFLSQSQPQLGEEGTPTGQTSK